MACIGIGNVSTGSTAPGPAVGRSVLNYLAAGHLQQTLCRATAGHCFAQEVQEVDGLDGAAAQLHWV